MLCLQRFRGVVHVVADKVAEFINMYFRITYEVEYTVSLPHGIDEKSASNAKHIENDWSERIARNFHTN